MGALSAKPDVSWMSIVLLSLLLAVLGLIGGLAVKLSLRVIEFDGPVLDGPQTIAIAPRSFGYRAAGEYYKNGYAVDGPMRTVTMTRPLTIMKYQVSNADYARCVAAGACVAAEPEFPDADRDDTPATGVSFGDAQAYASWLSHRTGEVWMLPTDEQLAFAAGSRFPDDALGADTTNSSNPADRWLAKYRREAEGRTSRDPVPKPLGHFGENEFGIADFAGNVWEWTTTCSRRIELESQGDKVSDTASCGIYHAIGKHRALMIFFVRNPKGGGCAVGAPPDNLGFRLVKDTRWHTRLTRILRESGLPL